MHAFRTFFGIGFGIIMLELSGTFLNAQSAPVMPVFAHKETVLGQVNIAAVNGMATVMAEDGCQSIFSVHEADNSRIVLNGRTMAEYTGTGRPIFKFSPDGHHMAYATYKNSKVSLVVDGKSGPEYDEIDPNSIVFSPNGKRVAYAARSGREWFVLIDGQPAPAFDGVQALEVDPNRQNLSEFPLIDTSATLEFAPIFTADSQHVAYLAEKNSTTGIKFQIVMDGVPGPEYDTIFSLFVSIDGLHVGYVGFIGSDKQFVIDGTPGPLIAHSSDEIISPDGKRTAYAIVGSRGLQQVVVDGLAGPIFDGIADQSLYFSPDSKHVVYVAATNAPGTGGKNQVVLDGVPGPLFDRTMFPRFSLDSKQFAYAVQNGDTMQIVKWANSGQEIAPMDSAINGVLRMSPDGQQLAYVAKKDSGECVVVNGVPGTVFDEINSFKIKFSPNSKRVAYLNQKDKKWQVVVDGIAGPEFDEIKDDSLQFGSDSSHMAYVGKEANGWVVIVDGKPGPVFDQIAKNTPVFSADGQHIAYVGIKGAKSQVFLDGSLSPECDEVSASGSLFGPSLGVLVKNLGTGAFNPGLFQTGGLVFSPSGGHLAYSARNGSHIQMVIDGNAGPAFEGIVAGPAICKNCLLEYLAFKKNQMSEDLVRVDVAGFGSATP
jgi:hypothetical protein